jgi:hypothetical protein
LQFGHLLSGHETSGNSSPVMSGIIRKLLHLKTTSIGKCQDLSGNIRKFHTLPLPSGNIRKCPLPDLED